MSPRAALAIAVRETQQLDWPRLSLAFVTALALGRMFAGSAANDLIAGACAIAFITSQLSLTRELGVGLAYFAAPLGPRELSRALALVPAAACAGIVLAFPLGAASRGAAPPALWAAAAGASTLCALVMQSARLRSGTARMTYRSIALLLACLIAALCGAHAWSAGLALWLGAGYAALRGFSETIRRYDPA